MARWVWNEMPPVITASPVRVVPAAEPEQKQYGKGDQRRHKLHALALASGSLWPQLLKDGNRSITLLFSC